MPSSTRVSPKKWTNLQTRLFGYASIRAMRSSPFQTMRRMPSRKPSVRSRSTVTMEPYDETTKPSAFSPISIESTKSSESRRLNCRVIRSSSSCTWSDTFRRDAVTPIRRISRL